MVDKQRVTVNQIREITSVRGQQALRRFMDDEWLDDARYHHRHHEEVEMVPPRATDICPNIGQMMKLLSAAYILKIDTENPMGGWKIELTPKTSLFTRQTIVGSDCLCDCLWYCVKEFLNGHFFRRQTQDQRTNPNVQVGRARGGQQVFTDADLQRLRVDNMLAPITRDPLLEGRDPSAQMAQRLREREQTIPLWRS